MMAPDEINIIKNLESRELHSQTLRPVNLLKRNRIKTLRQRDVKGKFKFSIFDLLSFVSGHTGCVNALEFSNDEKYLISGRLYF